MYHVDDIRSIHLEITSRCNASCPMCPRNIDGGAVNPNLPLTELSLADVERIFPTGFLRQLEVIYVCGNYGDPIAARDTPDIFAYFRRTNAALRLGMHSNGSARGPSWWTRLAGVMQGGPHYVRFGIDGLADTNHLYRRGTRWPTIMANVRAFIAAGGRAEWDFIVFKHNQHQVEEARRLAREMGFVKFHVRKSGRFCAEDELTTTPRAPVRDRRGMIQYWIEEPTDPAYLNPAFDALPALRERYDDFANYLDRTPIQCKAAASRKIYVSAEGLVFPCCWLGALYTAKHSREKQQIADLIAQAGGHATIDARKNGIAAVLRSPLFQQTIPESWDKPGVAAGKLAACARACGAGFDPLAVQRRPGLEERLRRVRADTRP